MEHCNNAAELAAMINVTASILAKDKTVAEIEKLAVLFDMLSDTLFAIAIVQKKQDKICEEREKHEKGL